jgi:pimeloyl-ACP methyl ester carboxylesterase
LDALQTIANGNDTPASEALVSLARIGQRHARLEAMLDSPDQYYRLNAALAAAYLGDKARTWHLTEMLNEASAPIERVYLQSALAIMGRPNGAAELHRELIAMASEPDFNKRLDIFFMHRYLQMAVLDGLQAGGESAAGLWHVWHDELQPLDPVPKPVEVTTKAKAASVAVPAVPGTVGENAEPTEPLNDDDAEHLMTVDKIARANGTNSVPPPLPPPPSRKTRKGFLVGVVVLALFILLGIYLAPYIHTLLANQLSPVVVPNSHFVGQHGRNKKLLVFVHGVMGDMDNTWVNAETHASWPELITGDPDLTDFDVFVYGYASPAMGDASTIGQISVRFLQQLKDFRFFNNYNEVSFVTHSMGGIVTKRTLDMLNTQADNSILQKVHTVIYISVPSNGANLAALASWLSENPQFKGMSPKNAADFLQSVEGDWANLLRQRTPSSPFPRTYSAYETLPTGPVEVVPELYTSGLSDLPVIGFDYNHINIVKPKDREAELYRWVKARLLEEVSVLPAK